MEILDSGARVEFDSGAVRDIKEGKGRCDLLPLDVFTLIEYRTDVDTAIEKEMKPYSSISMTGRIFIAIERYKETLNTKYLSYAAREFISYSMTLTGLTSSYIWIDLSKHYEEGAKKYADRNWQKGIPVHSFIDSATRHLIKFIDNWDDEPHDRAFLWNIVGAIWTHMHRPDLIDINLCDILDNEEKTNDR